MKISTLKSLLFTSVFALAAIAANAQIGNTHYGTNAYPSLTGGGNSAFGAYALNANTTGNYNTAIGSTSLYKNTAGSSNTSVGRWSMYNNINGSSNVAVGSLSLYINSYGVENTAIGTNSMQNNTVGSYNTATGMNTMVTSTNGFFNVANGAYSLYTNSGSDNTAIGSYSMYKNSNGADNTAVGMYSLYNNQTGNSNTVLGYNSLPSNQTGSSNTIVGSYSGGGIFTGSGNTIIGANVTGLSPSLTNTIILADGAGNQRFVIDNTGKAKIGSASLTTPGTYKLYVETGILTEKVVVALANSADWADYVFAPEYKLTPLSDVAKFVKTNRHLPNVPSANEVAKNGINLGAMDAKLLEKIEELTLYIIELENRISTLEEKK